MFEINRDAIRELELPYGRKLLGEPLYSLDCVLAGVWLMAYSSNSDQLKQQLADLSALSVAADNPVDATNDMMSLLAVIAAQRDQLRVGTEPNDDVTTLVFYGLAQTLKLHYWWPLELLTPELQPLIDAALKGLQVIYGQQLTNEVKILDACAFVAEQGGEHYQDRGPYLQRLRNKASNP